MISSSARPPPPGPDRRIVSSSRSPSATRSTPSPVSARESKLRLGFSLAVDDLGAGYAGLSSFSILEPEFVKLDMSLVPWRRRLEAKTVVIRSLLSLCERELSMYVVCEGVETEAERDTLVELGCDLLQGYFFARPSKSSSLHGEARLTYKALASTAVRRPTPRCQSTHPSRQPLPDACAGLLLAARSYPR